MFNLMKIEFSKNKMKNDIWGFIAANVGIFLLSTVMAFVVGFNGMTDKGAIYYHIEQIVQVTTVIFIVYGAILMCGLIIDEFNDGTIKNMFLYPESRGKIVLSKIFTVLAFVTISIIATLFIQLIIFVATNGIFHFYSNLGYGHLMHNPIIYITALISAIGFTLLSVIVSYKSKSTILTILLILLLSGKTYAGGYETTNTFTIVLLISTFVVGLTTCVYVLKDVKNIDV